MKKGLAALDHFWLNLLILLGFGAATVVKLVLLFEHQKAFAEKHTLISSVILIGLLVFGLFRLVRFFQFLKRRNWLVAILTAFQICLLAGLFWANCFLMMAPLMGHSVGEPMDNF